MALDCLFAASSRFVPPQLQREGSGALRQPPNTPRRQGGFAISALPERAKEI